MISAHVLVKDEARFIWYSVMSIINYVDNVRIWDTGSSDGTLEIIEEIRKTPQAKGKIFFRGVQIDKFSEDKLRQEMLNVEFTDTLNTVDWILIVDGDEIWWEDSIKSITETIKKEGCGLESIIVPTKNVIGDMFHYQEKEAGRYHLAGKIGHYGLRALNKKIPGLHAVGRHGIFSWRDENNVKIEDRDESKIKFINAPYIHTTHLRRAGSGLMDKKVFKRKMKFKYEIGNRFPKDFYYPEVFFRSRPSIVPSIWNIEDNGYKLKAVIQTPLKKIRRRYFMKGIKHGY